MPTASSAARSSRRAALAAIVAAGLIGLADAGPAAAAKTATVRLQPESAAATRTAEARATTMKYLKLSGLGVTANSAVLTGKTLDVRLTARRRVELRLAVVQGKKITAFKVLTVKPGKYKLSGRLNLTPKGSGLQLRVTARIRGVRARGFVKLTLGNRAPAALGLTTASVPENKPAGTVVGTLVGLDPDFGDTLSYSLVGGPGATDNGAFKVVGNVLQTTAAFDFEARSSYSVRARVTDAAGATFDKAFTVTVTDANDAPTTLGLSNGAVAENQPAGTTVGTLSGSDADAGQALSFAFAAGAGDTDNASFALVGASLRTAATFDREAKAAYTVRLRVTDAGGASLERAFAITVTDVDDAPILATTAGALAYTENDPATVLDGGLTVSDADNDTLASATVKLTAGLEATDELVFTNTPQISGSYDAPSGTLTLTGVTTKANWQTALRAVRYRSTSDDPGTAKTVTFTVSDGTLPSAAATKAITVTTVNDVPAVTTSAGALGYTENDPATAVDAGLTVVDPDSQLTGATVQITGNHASPEDVLALPSTPGIASAYTSATGTLTLTGTASAAAYQAALQSVTYRNTSSNPSTLARTITFIASDAGGPSAPAARTVSVSATDNAPDVDASAGALAYTENDAATAIDTTITITDIDSVNLTGATVQITGNYVQGEDLLALPAQPNVTATFDAPTGRLTLTGTATLAEYETALEAVTYENSSQNPSTATRTVTYQAKDATAFGLADTHGITVAAVDDSPTAVNDSATVAEDAGATAVPVLTNETDPDAGPVSIASVTQPASGAVVITGGGTGLTYAPNANSCNTPPGTTPDTFTYTLTPGGSTATVSMAVTCVDDSPVAANDTATVAEDAVAGAIDVLANDADADGGPKSIASVTQPTNGTAIITGGGTGLTYEPDADYCNTAPVGASADTFTYTLTPGTSTATVSVTVTCEPDAPTVDAGTGSLTYAENAAATAIAPAVDVDDVDPGAAVASATVQITANYAGAQDVLALGGVHAGITASLSGGTLTLTGPATPAAFTAALADVTYDNTSDSPSSLTRTVTFTVTDDTALTGSDTRDIQITPADDAPVAVANSATVLEDAGATAVDVLTNDTDPDGGPKSITSVTQPAGGAVVVTGGGTGLTYAPNPDYCNDPPGTTPDTFTYTLTPGGASATVSMTVTCAPDAPVVNATNAALAYVENDAATPVDPGVTVADADAGAAVASATVQITANYAAGQDVLALSGVHAGITPSLSGDTLTLTGPASPAAFQAALRDVTYVNTSEAPSALTRTVTFTATDDTALSGSDTRSITVASVDDNPIAVADSATVLEDATATAVPVLTNDADPDGGPKSITSVTQPAGGTVVITGGGTGLTYAPNANVCNDPPGTTPDTFTYTLTPGGASASVSMTVTCVNDAPVADDETFNAADSAVGNTALVVDDPSDGAPTASGAKKTITGDILAGDTDVDGPGPLVVTAGTFASNDGGTVVVQSDGDFTFTPAAGTSCTDTSDFFDYTVSDQNPGTPGTDTGRVTIAITGCVWYVSNNASGNSGTSTAPFDTLAQAQTASATGDTIYVYDGDNSTTGYTAGIDLKTNQRLLGETATLQIGSDVLQTGVPANRPTITDSGADVVKLASGNTVRGVQLDPQGGGGIAGGNGTGPGSITGGTIDDVRIIDTGTAGTQPGLELDTTAGTFNVSDLTVDNTTATGATSGSIGVRLNSAGTVNLASSGTVSVATTGAKGLDATGTNMGAGSVFDDITVTGSGSGGVSMTNTTGTTTFGDGSGTDLALTTSAGTGFLLSNAGTVTVPAGGAANVSASGGPAVDVTGTSGASLTFDDVDSTTSTGDGINIAGLGTGTFSVSSGSTITGAGGIDFDLDGGSGAVTFDGAITDDLGQLIRVQNTTGGTKDFNGTVTDGGDGDGSGIALASNTGATIRFDGGLTLATGANPAFAATGGGTLAITDPSGATNNTLATTTGTALNVANTTISDDDLTFEKVSSNGAADGIVLSTTSNANGRFVVTGNGGTCSSAANCTGGAIQSSTGAGIALTSVPGGASFTRMAVTGGGDDGIRATTVGDLDLADSVVLNNGDNHSGGAEERGLDYLNLTGTPQILRTTVSGSDDSNANIRNTIAGSTTLTVDQSTFSDSKFNAGLRLRGEGASTMNATVTNSVFSLNADPGFSMQTDAANTVQQTLLFDGNDVSGGSTNAVSGRPQVSINADSASTVKVSVTNNDIKSAAGAEVILNTLASHTGTFDAKVTGNDINDAQPGALDALADGGSAIWGWAHGDGTTRMEIRNNTVANWGGRGLELSHNDGIGTADYTVTGNTFSTPDVSANTYEGAYILAGGAGGDTSDVCVDLENNDMDLIGRQGVSDIALDRFSGSTLRFADFNDTSVPNLQTNLRGKNTASPVLTVETFSFGPIATTATACSLPVGVP